MKMAINSSTKASAKTTAIRSTSTSSSYRSRTRAKSCNILITFPDVLKSVNIAKRTATSSLPSSVALSAISAATAVTGELARPTASSTSTTATTTAGVSATSLKLLYKFIIFAILICTAPSLVSGRRYAPLMVEESEGTRRNNRPVGKCSIPFMYIHNYTYLSLYNYGIYKEFNFVEKRWF